MHTTDKETETERWAEMRDISERQTNALERIARRLDEVADHENADRERRAKRARPAIIQDINTLFMEAARAAEKCEDAAPAMEDVYPSAVVTGVRPFGDPPSCVGHFVFNALMNLHSRVHAVLSGDPLTRDTKEEATDADSA